MSLSMRPDAILFDMDGVLIDSFESWRHALNAALQAFDQEEISEGKFKSTYWGHDLRTVLENMGLDVRIATFCNTIYTEHVDEIHLFSKTKDTLRRLDSYKKAIITNTPKHCTRHILKKFGIGKYFDTIVTSAEVEQGKPHPDMIFRACELLHVDPSDTVLVGDTESDVKAGRAAGCMVVGINTEADYTISSIVGILELVE